MPHTAQLLGVVAAQVADRTGLTPPAWLLRDRTEGRARAVGLPLEGYLRSVGGDPAELARLIESLRIGETRFFRHHEQIAQLKDQVLPTLLRRSDAQRRSLRVWSAGCATGEEVWSLAMLLADLREREAAPAEEPPPPDLLGTDLSPEALRVAQEGDYPAAAGDRVPEELARRYLVPRPALPSGAGRLGIAPALRQRVPVRFLRHNLLDPSYPGSFDLILCRNVLIYFDPERSERVVGRLRASLLDGGVLLLGAAEALPQEAAAPAPRREARSAPPLDKAAPVVLRLSGSYGDGERLKEQLRPFLQQGGSLAVDLDGAEFLDDGDARVLRRAGEVLSLRLSGSRPAVRRWLQRHRLAGAEVEG